MSEWTKPELKELIAAGKLPQAISVLKELTLLKGDEGLHNEVLMLSARFENYKKRERLGTDSAEQSNVALARINEALLEVVDQLERPLQKDHNAAAGRSETFGMTAPENKTGGFFSVKWIGMALILLTLGGWGITKIFNGAGENEALQLTIYVHGPGGLQDIVLENEGELLVDFDNRRDSRVIGEDGRTNFGEIPAKFRNREIPIRVRAAGFVVADPEKKYLLDGKPVYFEVKPDPKLGEIRGVIRTSEGDAAVGNVEILIANRWTTRSDSLGFFQFSVPSEELAESYALTIRKEGYRPQNIDYYPRSGAIEIRLKKPN